MILKVFVLLTLIKLASGSKKDYSQYTLYRSVPSNQSQVAFLRSLDSEPDVDFWIEPRGLNKSVDLLIGPAAKEKFLTTMDERGIPYMTLIENVQSAIDNQTVKSYVRRRMTSFDWKSYYRLQDIYNWFRDLENKYPGEVEVMELGKTYEGRKILGVKVLLKSAKARSTVIVEGGIHAREWIAPAVSTYFLNQVIVSGKSKNKSDPWREIARQYEWYFVPVMNPDGYDYTHTSDRNWRKNRFEGYGVDINRNFDSAFGTVGVERYKKKKMTYCGPHAFSEQESKALAALIRSKHERLEYYLAFHSYGQYMILPYAHSKKHHENYDEVEAIAKKAASLIYKRYRTKYKAGTAFDTIEYTTSGVSGCWVKKKFKTRFVITFELRDSDESVNKLTQGFLLHPSLILPTCYETMDGLAYILTLKSKSFRLLKGPEDLNGQTIISLNKVTLIYCICIICFMLV